MTIQTKEIVKEFFYNLFDPNTDQPQLTLKLGSHLESFAVATLGPSPSSSLVEDVLRKGMSQVDSNLKAG